MASTTTERNLVELEKKYWQAIKDKDVNTALDLTDFPVIVTGAQGIGSLERQTFAAMMNDPSYTIHKFELDDDLKVRMLSDDVAVVAYKIREELTVDGKPVTVDAANSSTWVRRDGRWVCALHSESITGDPFGRDRH